MEDSEDMLAQYRQTGAIVYGIDGDVSELVTITKGELDEELWESGEGVIVDGEGGKPRGEKAPGKGPGPP